MASKVTPEDILSFNKRYYECKNYAQVARETGFSSATVRKYVDKNWKPVDISRRKIFDVARLPEDFDFSIFKGVKNFGELCILSDKEKEEMKELWEEMDI